MEIRVDDLSDPRIADFLEEHINDMRSISPPESKHALDLEELKKPDITFWTAWEEGELVGCGALKKLTPSHAEIKSMRVPLALRGRGIASKLLTYILKNAELMGYIKLSLETGSMPFFEPARKLYAKFGFKYCDPFSDYKESPYNVFMSLSIVKDV